MTVWREAGGASMEILISLLIAGADTTEVEVCRNIIATRFSLPIVHTSGDVDEAVDLFKYYQHDIVISDLFFPKEKGPEVAFETFDTKPDAFVLFMAGEHVQDPNRPHTPGLYLDRIFNNPLDADNLVRSITSAIAVIMGAVK